MKDDSDHPPIDGISRGFPASATGTFTAIGVPNGGRSSGDENSKVGVLIVGAKTRTLGYRLVLVSGIVPEFGQTNSRDLDQWSDGGQDLALRYSEAPAERCGSDSRRLVSFFQFRRSPGLPHLTVLRMRGTTGSRYGERAGSCEASGRFFCQISWVSRAVLICAVWAGAKIHGDHGRGHSERGWAFRRGVNRSR